jgi:hypothetical protein
MGTEPAPEAAADRRPPATRARRVRSARRTLWFPSCRVDIEDAYVETTFFDGAKVPAVPHERNYYRLTAYDVGYGSDVVRLNAEHDPLHTWLAHRLGLPYSPVLWAVAHDTLHLGDFGREEDLCLAFQRCLNTGECLPALQRLVDAGLHLPRLRAEALALLRG